VGWIITAFQAWVAEANVEIQSLYASDAKERSLGWVMPAFQARLSVLSLCTSLLIERFRPDSLKNPK
jgi:hypothetical protein